jgi:hypothetical protein
MESEIESRRCGDQYMKDELMELNRYMGFVEAGAVWSGWMETKKWLPRILLPYYGEREHTIPELSSSFYFIETL